jgi:hypothetical protein
LSGINCEWDGQCDLDSFCISAHCTQASCIPGETFTCYSGAVGTNGIGECRSGFYLCTENFILTQECIGEVVPAPDEGYLACNGRDDNCDGITDPLNTEAIDILFAMDMSGSMASENMACGLAIQQTAAVYDHHSIRMGLVVFPDPVMRYPMPPSPKVAIPLVEYSQFAMQMNFIAFSTTSTGSEEPSYDIPWLAANDLLTGIVRRPGARLIIIIFTDEQGQSYLDDEVTEESMCESIEGANIGLYVITYPDEIYRIYSEDREVTFREDWDECATILELSTDPADTTRSLSEIADSVCG